MNSNPVRVKFLLLSVVENVLTISIITVTITIVIIITIIIIKSVFGEYILYV